MSSVDDSPFIQAIYGCELQQIGSHPLTRKQRIQPERQRYTMSDGVELLTPDLRSAKMICPTVFTTSNTARDFACKNYV